MKNLKLIIQRAVNKSILAALLLVCAFGLPGFGQTTTNNPGVPIFGAGGTASGLQFVFVNGLGDIAYPANFFTQNAGTLVNSAGATNGNGSRVAFVNDVFPVGTNFTTPEVFGALGGTNNDTAAFSNMLAFCSASSPGVFALIRNRSYTISNLVLPNNVTLRGEYATLNQISGSTNFLVDGLNSTNCSISGLIFSGTNNLALSGRAMTTTYGLRINQLGGNVVQGCTFTGFGGYSLYVQGTNTGSGGWDQRLSTINDCICYSNYYGPVFLSTSTGSGTRAEYISSKGLQSFENVVGIVPDAGNETILGARITGNTVGVQIPGSSPNGQHGTLSACMINHNTQSMSLTGVSNGELFDGCWFAADGGGGIAITNSRGVSLDNCYLDTGIQITTTSGTAGWNMVENCEYTGVWGKDITWLNQDGTFAWFNNHSRDTLTGDWSHKYEIPLLSGIFQNTTLANVGTQSPGSVGAYDYVDWNNTSPIFQVYKVPHSGASTNSLFTFWIQSITNQPMNLQVNAITKPASGGGGSITLTTSETFNLTNGLNMVTATNNWADNTSSREVAFVWTTSTNTTTYLLDAEYGY